MEYELPSQFSGIPAKITALALLSLFIIIITIFCLNNNFQIVFTHLYYIPIIVASYWFRRNGIFYAVLLSAFYIGAVYFLTPFSDLIFLAAIIRAAVFIGISAVIAIFAILLHDQHQQILDSEAKFRNIWESIQAGIILVDAETHTIIAANPEAQKMTGYSEKEMTGHLCHKYICPAEQGKCPISDLGQKVDRKERILLSSDGTKVPVLKTVTEMQTGGKKFYIENFIDISQIKEAENTLIAYIREATLRIRNPVELVRDNLREIRGELTGQKSPPGYIATALAIQEKNMDGILNNLQELERAVAEKRTEIPDALREYLKR